MTTGYTHPVEEGQITDLATFALRCSRATGYLSGMRDDSLDAPLPKVIEPHTKYDDEKLARLYADLDRLRAMTPEEIAVACEQEYQTALTELRDYLASRNLREARLEAMREQVRAWIPPSDAHVDLRAFMLQQLGEPPNYQPEMPKMPDPNTWAFERAMQLGKDIAYHTQHRVKAVRQAAEGTAWLNTLRASLPPVPASPQPEQPVGSEAP